MAKKRIYLIKKSDGRQYWTAGYEKKEGFLIFRVNKKDGGTFGVNLNMNIVSEIQEREVEDKEVAAESNE